MNTWSHSKDKILTKSIAVSGYSVEDLANLLGINPSYARKCLYTHFPRKHVKTLLGHFIEEGWYDGVYLFLPDNIGVTSMLLRLKKALDYTQHDMAKELDMTHSHYRRIEETGDPTLSEYELIKKLAYDNNIIIYS